MTAVAAQATDAEVLSRIREGKLVETVEQMSPAYLEGMIRILTVSADTERASMCSSSSWRIVTAPCPTSWPLQKEGYRMSAPDNAAIVRALIKAAYDRDYDSAASFASPNIQVVDEGTGQTFTGHDGLRQFVEYWLSVFHDYQHDITNLIADDHGVAIEYVFQAWHGDHAPVQSDVVPGSGRSIQSRSAAFFQMEDGKVTGYHLYYNPPEQFP